MFNLAIKNMNEIVSVICGPCIVWSQSYSKVDRALWWQNVVEESITNKAVMSLVFAKQIRIKISQRKIDFYEEKSKLISIESIAILELKSTNGNE